MVSNTSNATATASECRNQGWANARSLHILKVRTLWNNRATTNTKRHKTANDSESNCPSCTDKANKTMNNPIIRASDRATAMRAKDEVNGSRGVSASMPTGGAIFQE